MTKKLKNTLTLELTKKEFIELNQLMKLGRKIDGRQILFNESDPYFTLWEKINTFAFENLSFEELKECMQ